MNENTQCALTSLTLGQTARKKRIKGSALKGHACGTKRNHDSLTHLLQQQDKWQKCGKDVLRHTHVLRIVN